jgi:hypothetical protein
VLVGVTEVVDKPERVVAKWVPVVFKTLVRLYSVEPFSDVATVDARDRVDPGSF